jgi:HEPN domain-containing protein
MHGHERWLRTATDDLKLAQVGLEQELFEPSIYHCQQAAEKALKSYLIFKQRPVVRTHDLIELLERCLGFDKDFEKLYPATKQLNPFSTKFRYPTEYDILEASDLELAIKNAESILKFIVKKIAHPQPAQTTIYRSDI